MQNISLKSSPWVTAIRLSEPARFRLFCFPYAGAGASIFRSWPAHLPKEIDIYSLALPGRENRVRESPCAELPELIEKIADVIPAYFEKPFIFFGHCVGALIAYELVHELTRRKQPIPERLFLSGFRSPDLPNPNRVLNELPESEFIDEIRRYGGTSAVALQDEELLKKLIPALRADFALHEKYIYPDHEKLLCPLSVFGGSDDTLVSEAELAGWMNKTSRQADIRMLPGSHFYLNSHRNLLLEAIQNQLLKA